MAKSHQKQNQVDTEKPLVSICIPHYNVTGLLQLCLGAIRTYTRDIPYEVIVVDNGSDETSLQWLRSVPWIKIIERGEETPENWVYAMNTALDIGLKQAQGKYYLIMHSDVIVKNPAWLQSMIDKIREQESNAASGSWKLEDRSRVSQFLKDVTDIKRLRLWLRRKLLRDPTAYQLKRELCPRDFCALYITDVLRKNHLSFVGKNRYTAGETVYYDLKELGYTAGIIPVRKMMKLMDHIAHASGAILPDRRLNHKKKILQTRMKISRIYKRKDVDKLKSAVSA